MVRRAIEEIGCFTSVVMLSVANSSRRAAASRRSWLEHAERAGRAGKNLTRGKLLRHSFQVNLLRDRADPKMHC
jgi:hypothetical protein